MAFKPETDDVREAPALYILKGLIDAGASVTAYDPEAMDTFKVAIGEPYALKIQFAKDQKTVLNGIDALVICTEWNEFRRPDFGKFTEVMKHTVIFDGRNLFDLERIALTKIKYISVGRKSVNV